MICEDFQKLQSQILKRIFDCTTYNSAQELSGILKEAVNYSKEDIRSTLGNFGSKLASFSSYIDRETPHPDLFKLFDGELTSEEEGTFSRTAVDVLKLIKHGKEQGVSKTVFESLKKLVTKHKAFKTITQAIDHPEENLLHVRFVPLRSKRDAIRHRKMMQIVNPELLYKKGCDFWESGPTNFADFIRGQNLYQVDIEEAISRLEHFNNMGLKQMADEIQKTIDKLKKTSEDSQYFGFNKIPVYCASVILAKQANFKYNKKEISVSTDNFKYRFFADANNLFDDSHVKPLMLVPRIYTYGEMEEVASDQIKAVIEHLESFPESGGHALFDHYKVLVAGTDFLENHQKKAGYCFRMPDGTMSSGPRIFNCQLKLDSELIKQKEVPAVLLGERDGDCYFISYF